MAANYSLAIDPGTKCGWALYHGDQLVASGTWDLGARRHEGGGMRFLRLRGYLNQVTAANPVQAVWYEEVRRHLGTDAAHVYGGIVAVLSAWCEGERIPYAGIPVATVKRLATGKGNADKAAMMAAALAKWPDFHGDDNEADARWIGLAGLATIN